MNEKKPGENKVENKIKVTLIRSVIGTKESHRATVRGLGLKRLNHSVDLSDTPAVRGMINKVSYLLKMEASR
ncbi:MAG: 50S ribosomal protein L30 [Burkholderiales bacterium]|nr:50S ribosomal protein L30 [Burkholderiales bacterium]